MYKLQRIQNISIDLKKAWDFFSSPDNLKLITPDYLKFQIRSRSDAGEMYPGMMISYSVSPLLHISVNWATEVSQIKEHKYFIDNQIKGPYKIWHHEHHFKKTSTGVEMKDVLYYELPFGFFGRFFHKLFIQKRVEAIFNYRANKLKELFN